MNRVTVFHVKQFGFVSDGFLLCFGFVSDGHTFLLVQKSMEKRHVRGGEEDRFGKK